MYRILLILLLNVFFNGFVFGQEKEATIWFTDDSKVKGLGEIKNNTIYFRLTKEDKVEKWSYDIAKGLIFSGYGFTEKYEYIFCDKYNKPTLMEVIDEGMVYLYKDVSTEITPMPNLNSNGIGLGLNVSGYKSNYFVKRENEEKAKELTFSFKSRAIKYFADCEIVINKINKRIFTKNNIPELVAYYNNYCGE